MIVPDIIATASGVAAGIFAIGVLIISKKNNTSTILKTHTDKFKYIEDTIVRNEAMTQKHEVEIAKIGVILSNIDTTMCEIKDSISDMKNMMQDRRRTRSNK